MTIVITINNPLQYIITGTGHAAAYCRPSRRRVRLPLCRYARIILKSDRWGRRRRAAAVVVNRGNNPDSWKTGDGQRKKTEIGKTKIGRFGGCGTSSSHENWRRTEVERWHGAHRGRIVCWLARAHTYTLTHKRAREPPTAHAYRTRSASATAISQTVARTHTRTHGYAHTRVEPVKRLHFTRKLFDKCQVQDYKLDGPELGI